MRHSDLWIILFLFGTLLFNWPVLSVFAAGQPYAIFILWALFIALAGALCYVTGRERNR
jgi:hypothetical protein